MDPEGTTLSEISQREGQILYNITYRQDLKQSWKQADRDKRFLFARDKGQEVVKMGEKHSRAQNFRHKLNLGDVTYSMVTTSFMNFFSF